MDGREPLRQHEQAKAQKIERDDSPGMIDILPALKDRDSYC